MKEIHKVKLDSEQVEDFQKLLMDTSGMFIEKRRVPELERAITSRMISLGIFSYSEYYRFLCDHCRLDQELGHLVRALTVGESHFFRTPAQFEALRTCILPEIIRKKESNRRRLRIFSAGCATGEEPYSIVILLLETFPELREWQFEVVACDINDEFLDRAKSGVYSKRRLRLVSPEILDRYFRRSDNLYEISEDVKSQVKFHHFNLTDTDYSMFHADEEFDVIFCRNVLIYFDEKTARNVVRKLHQLLAEEGYLMLGYSETLFQLSDDLRSIHTEEAFFFQKHPSEKRVPPEVAVSLPERPLAREDILKTIGSQPYTGLRLARPKKVLTLQEQALPSEEEKLWEQAMEFFANEDFERAKNIFNKILAVEPDSAEGQVGMGLIFANQGHDEKAQQACQRARELDELLPELYLLQALLDQKNNRLKEAVKNYQRVLWLDPDYIIAYFNLGNIYLSMGRHADAQREFRNALELLDKQGDHFSLCFSGGLGRDALRHFCLEHI